MTSRKPQQTTNASRAPKRITATIPQAILEKLIQRSDAEGRSLSNLISYLLERGVEE
jgi:hypothetical protein